MKYPKDRNIHRPRHINQQGRPYFITGRTYFGLPYFEIPEAKETLSQAIKLAVKNYSLDLDAWVILDNHYHLLFRPPGSVIPEGLPCEVMSSEVTDLSVTRPFHIGKVIGTIHGRSSSLLKKLTRKRITIETVTGKSVTSSGGSDNFSCYPDWWKAKYWEEIKRKNIKFYGPRSVLAEKKRSAEFQKLLREGTPQELADFVRQLGSVWYQYTDHVVRDERDYFTHFNYTHQNPVKHGYVERMSDYRFSSIHRWIKEAGKDWLADCFRRYPVADFQPDMGDFN